MGATARGSTSPSHPTGWDGALLVAGLLIVVLVGVRLLLPAGPWRALVEIPVYLTGAGAVVRGMRRRRPVSVVAWWALAAGLTGFALSSAAETIALFEGTVDADADADVDVNEAGDVDVNEVGDTAVSVMVEAVLDVLGYLALTVAGLAALVTGRARRDWESWVDALTLLLAAALSAAVWADGPDILNGPEGGSAGVLSVVAGGPGVGFSLLTGVVLIAGARLALPGTGRSVSGAALFAAGSLALIGYAGKAATAAATAAGSSATATATFSASAVFDELPLLAVAGVALAAAHPSMTGLGQPAPATAAVTTTRLLGLGSALLLSPALVLVWTVRHSGDGYFLGTGIGALTGLTLWRIARLIADRERTRTALTGSEARLQALLQHAADVIAIIDRSGRLSYVSPAVTPLLGWAPADLTGTRALSLLDPVDRPRLRTLFTATTPTTNDPDGDGRPGSAGHASTGRAPATPVPAGPVPDRPAEDVSSDNVSSDNVSAGEVSAGDVRLCHAGGGTRWVEVRISRMLDEPAVAGWVVNAREVTERKHLEQQLRHQASTDPLTGLVNRSELLTRLGEALAPGAGPSAVLFLDLDDFKTVNDRWGHSRGDVLLSTVAARLRGCLRASDTAARLGGDEFAVMLTPADASRAQRVAARILDELRHPLDLNGHALQVTASIGSTLTRPGDTAAEVLRRADSAMYAAKRRGKNDYELSD